MITFIFIFTLIYIITIGLEIVINNDLEYYFSNFSSITYALLLSCPFINTIILICVLILIIIKKIKWKIKYGHF